MSINIYEINIINCISNIRKNGLNKTKQWYTDFWNKCTKQNIVESSIEFKKNKYIFNHTEYCGNFFKNSSVVHVIKTVINLPTAG